MNRLAPWLLGAVLVLGIVAAIAQLVAQHSPDARIEALINAPRVPDTAPQRIVLSAPADSGRYHGAYPDVGEDDESSPTAFRPSNLYHSHESRKDPP
jgi:hypothetical protein